MRLGRPLALRRRKGNSFQPLADEAFEDLLKKQKQAVALMELLEENVRSPSRANRKRT